MTMGGWISPADIAMRPDILNPLFADVTALKGVGPALARPLERLGLRRVVDLLFHLPSGWIDRVERDELMMADAGRTVSIVLTARDYRSSAGRGPTRVRPRSSPSGSAGPSSACGRRLAARRGPPPGCRRRSC